MADKSMTGDGAVVREQAQDAAVAWQDFTDYHGHTRTPCGPLGNLARAYLAQAAEIERLKIERHAFAVELKATTSAFIKADDAKRASEARAADLLKALEELLDYSGGADNALKDPYVVERAHAAIAAAKGETV